jgi:hypothetical protein
MILKSRKFQFAIAQFLAVMVMILLPSVVNMSADQTDTLYKAVPLSFFTLYFVLTGHGIMDALSMALGKQLPKLDGATEDLKDAIENP